MRGLIGMLAGMAVAVPALAQAPGGATMTVGHAPAARPGWGAGGWNGGGWGDGVRPGVPVGHPGGFVGRPGFPGGYGGYRRPFVGFVVPRGFVAPTYSIGNWSSYGLASPAAGYGWYRYYDDAVLVDDGGRVRDWRGGIDWDRGGDRLADADAAYDDGYDDGFDDGVDYAEDAVTIRGRTQRPRSRATDYGGSFGPTPGRPPAASWREDRPLLPPPPMRRGWSGDGHAGAPYGYAAGPGTTVYGQPGGATVVVVNATPAVTTTTTTTTTSSWETVAPKRVWHAPAKRRVATGKMLRR